MTRSKAASAAAGTAVLMALGAIVGLACGGNGDPDPGKTPTAGPSATPTLHNLFRPTATIAPTATRVPQPTASPSTGIVLYMLNNDLQAASLAPKPSLGPVPITSGTLLTQYAGIVDDPRPGREVYFAVLLNSGSPTAPRATSAWAVYKTWLPGGLPVELYRYTSHAVSDPVVSSYAGNAAVSPNGRYIAFADLEGLASYDVVTGVIRRLLTRGACTGPGNCWSYRNPKWDPAGETLLVTKSLWEGSAEVLIDPFQTVIHEEDLGAGASGARWSPDGTKICFSELRYGAPGGRMLVFDVESGRLTDIGAQLGLPPMNTVPAGTQARDCAWHSDGRLAFAYGVLPHETTHIVVLSPFLAKQADYEVADYVSIVAWIPDGSGLLFNRPADDRGRPTSAGIFDFEQGVRDLPFDADTVVAVIPSD